MKPTSGETVSAVGLVTIGVVGIAALLTVAMALDALLVTMLWKWYVVPLFGLAPLNIAGAVGLSLLARTLRPIPTNIATKEDEETWQKIAGPVLHYALIFGIGYLAKGWL